MSVIRLDCDSPILNGQTLTFKSPANCSEITGLKVYYSVEGVETSKTFQFADAHGNNVGSIDLFASNVFVKVILDIDSSKAYVQNADTNSYLEGKIEEKDFSKVSEDDFKGKFDSALIVIATSTDGVAYTATAPGVTSLKTGTMIVIIPNMTSTSAKEVTLDVNGLGAKNIYPSSGVSTSHYAYPVSEDWLKKSFPVLLMYSGIWRAVSYPLISTLSIVGTMPVSKGGTDATTADKALENLGAAPVQHTHDITDVINGVSLEDIANLYVWGKYTEDPSLYEETVVENLVLSDYAAAGGIQTNGWDSVPYAQEIEYSTGAVSLVDPSTAYINSASAAKSLRNHYIKKGDTIYYIRADATFTKNDAGTQVTVDLAKKVTPAIKLSNVASQSKDAYPANGKQDGYWYVYRKKLGD